MTATETITKGTDSPVDKSDPNYVRIFDTTLRDGEQSPGCSMNLEEKVRVAKILEELGVDIIEAGFPIASNGDFEAVREVANTIKTATVAGLARAAHQDIERAWEAVQGAELPRIHTFLSTSPLHMKFKLQMEPDEVHEAVIDSVSYARNLCPDVEWSPEDGSRTEHDFLCRTVESAIRAGAGTVNIPDTVGYAVPGEFAALIEMLFNRVPNIDKAVISVHCHNDLGLAVANSLAAVGAGARQVECTINGIGERAGNCALEEIIMALRTRHDAMPYLTGADSTLITRASHLVSTITGFNVQPNKAIVGANAFAHESGIHQDGVLKNAETYEIMTPESVGLNQSNLVMGKHSGSHAFREKLKDLGYGNLGDNAIRDAFQRFKDLADKKHEVFDEDLQALVSDTKKAAEEERFKLVVLEATARTGETPEARIVLAIDGEEREATSTGAGPVDAAFKAIEMLAESHSILQLYSVNAITAGTDSQGEVTVRLEKGGRIVNGHGADVDIITASAKAYLNALNHFAAGLERAHPQAADV